MKWQRKREVAAQERVGTADKGGGRRDVWYQASFVHQALSCGPAPPSSSAITQRRHLWGCGKSTDGGPHMSK